MQGALGGELFEQGTGAEFVEARQGRLAQDRLQIASAVEALDPLADGWGQAAQRDRTKGVCAELQGALIAEDASQGGLHTWPHGGKVSMPEQDPERVRCRLWITSANVSPPCGNSRPVVMTLATQAGVQPGDATGRRN
ncbi:hypothetical protein BKM31_52250 [[Actinomadura] parvosata subsp. kistnae]|uniref:Uncharacterized protein n=1 Tax=[Actinomadura] parvosata subsp. kistnae TaxID=1909395 RepID=A0A1V0AFE0_9ACTN|nr:hypothetical protein BKM31_52250 [Nonomuraea sp. ATCC 55076]